MRGILFLVRLAAATGRVLLVHHTTPLRLEEVRLGLGMRGPGLPGYMAGQRPAAACRASSSMLCFFAVVVEHSAALVTATAAPRACMLACVQVLQPAGPLDWRMGDKEAEQALAGGVKSVIPMNTE